MVNTNTHNSQQNLENIQENENNSQLESPHCLMTFPEDIGEMKESNSETSQSTPADQVNA